MYFLFLADGTFRFRGLTPKCQYSIQLLHGDSIEKLIPSEVSVTMREADHNLEKPIVAMRAFETMDTHLKVTEYPKPAQASQLKISMTAVDSNTIYFNTKSVTGALGMISKYDIKSNNLYIKINFTIK